MTIRGLLFDMDGVISNTEPLHVKIDTLILKEYGVKPDERWVEIKGLREIDVYRRAIEMYGIENTRPEDMLAKKIKYFHKLRSEIVIFEGVEQILARLKAEYKIALVSSSPKEIVELVVGRFKLGRLFNMIITGDDITYGKPNPEPYLKAAHGLGLRPEECAVIEDSLNGVMSAKAAGMLCIGITNTFAVKELRQAGADRIIGKLAELEATLAKA